MKKTPVALLCLLYACNKHVHVPPPPPPVSVVKPLVKDIPLYIEYIGHMEANITIDVKPQVSGIITGVLFNEGDVLRAGDVIATIDNRPYIANLEKAEGLLAQNLANLQYSRETVTRYTQLAREDFVSPLNFDQYLTTVLVDEAIIQQNKAEVETAKINLGYCTITAPIDCVTGNLQIDIGNYVTGGGQDTIVTINQIAPIKAVFYIPEKDLPSIQKLQKEHPLQVRVFLYEDRGCAFDGTLSLINNQVDTNTGTILVKALLPNETYDLWPGEFVVVRLLLGEQKNAILIPSEAVQVGQNGHFVFIVKEDSTVDMRPVSIGQAEDDFIVIENGIAPGETVVLKGQLALYPGAHVSVQKDQGSL